MNFDLLDSDMSFLDDVQFAEGAPASKKRGKMTGKPREVFGIEYTFTLSDEVIAKVVAKTRGLKRTSEQIDNIVNARKGYKHSEETKAKLSAANRGKTVIPWNKGLTGVISEEGRAKIGAARRGKVDSPEVNARRSAALKGKKKNISPEGMTKLCKKIVTPLGEFPSVKAAAEAHNFPGGWTIQKLTKKFPTEYYYI